MSSFEEIKTFFDCASHMISMQTEKVNGNTSSAVRKKLDLLAPKAKLDSYCVVILNVKSTAYYYLYKRIDNRGKTDVQLWQLDDSTEIEITHI